ncbi:TadE/TadG family type IV pilus assembly protein [Streptomyces sp. WM6378]|uniref:TadE/TadG family type IV pilus assembly protein n=1 Tax=Streptomyces sp. WM6378 TaxID=1415557 RepID=UPI0006C30E15|nr:TadE family protein [Streptomyces sp. WM6378]KOU37616.1 hypothetical protein ADK54_31350 [Streptomyces sp. WM6378]
MPEPTSRQPRWRLGERWRQDRGAMALDVALIFPVVLLMLFALIQGAFYFHARQVAQHAAQIGVDAERAYDAAPGSGPVAADAFLTRAGGSLSHPVVSVDAPAGGQVSVLVTGDVITMVPGWTLHVSSRVQAPREEFTP